MIFTTKRHTSDQPQQPRGKSGTALLWTGLLLLPAALHLPMAGAQSDNGLPAPEQHYMASINESGWYWERHADACHLMHAIPGFGLAVFSRAADGAVALRVYTGNPPAESRTVDLWSAPRDWDASGFNRIGSVEGAPGPETFRFGSDMAVRVLRELERGAFPTLSFDDWHAPDTTLAVSLSNAGFRPKYRAFMRCRPSQETQQAGPNTTSETSEALTVIDQNPAGDAPAATGELVTVSTRQTLPEETTITIESDNGLPASPPSRLLARHGQAIIPAELIEAEYQAELEQQRERERAQRAAEEEERRAEAEAQAEAENGDRNGNGDTEEDAPTDAVHEMDSDIPDVVHFVAGDTGLTRTEMDRINEFLDAMDEDSEATITITGHTGSTAPEAYNEELGRDRANSVREFLMEQGIAENRIVVATAGSRNRVSEDDSPLEQAANRRARLHVGERD